MDDITKKKLDHEADAVRDSMPAVDAHVRNVHDNTHATRAHMTRLGVEQCAFTDGRITVALMTFGAMLGRLVMDCHQSRHEVEQYLHCLKMDTFWGTALSDGIVQHLGIEGAQQLERLAGFALREVRSCLRPDCDEWAFLSFLITFIAGTLRPHWGEPGIRPMSPMDS